MSVYESLFISKNLSFSGGQNQEVIKRILQIETNAKRSKMDNPKRFFLDRFSGIFLALLGVPPLAFILDF